MKVAAYQAPLLASGSRAAIGLVAAQRAACEAEDVAILLCPEAVLGGLADDAADPFGLAIRVATGELAGVLAPLASDRVTTIVGFTEAGADGRLYNSAEVFARGKVLGVYRKRHPAIRSSVYSPGDESPVFEIAGLRFGLMICNDTNHPELANDLTARGAEALFVPSNNALRPEHADVVALTRAVDVANARRSGLPVIRADVAGDNGERLSLGSSAIIDSRGVVLQAGPKRSEALLVAELDL